MPLSPLRIRLAAWFALTFVVGLMGLNLALYVYLHRQSDHRLTRGLQVEAVELAEAVRYEYAENPAAGLADASRKALSEWPGRKGAFAVYTPSGTRLAARGDTAFLRRMPLALSLSDTAVTDVPIGGGQPIRQVTLHSAGSGPAFWTRVGGSTRPISEESEALAFWLSLSPPIVLVLGLVGGYILSRRSLRPIERLERAVAAIAPHELDRRLPVGPTLDEIDQLAGQFNALLERLQRAQTQNRRFVQEAAHQIRTPLTLVLGEADLGLDRPRTPLEQSQALERIRTAASHMKHRVDELLLLARAEAGERPALDTVVELDGLALECTDLMRARAHRLGRHLELRRVDAVSVRGNEALLKEGVLELIENACCHGGVADPIGISAFPTDSSACLLVASPLASSEEEPSPQDGRHGVGLTIVRWIAAQHGGVMTHTRDDRFNVYGLLLPALPPDAADDDSRPAGAR